MASLRTNISEEINQFDNPLLMSYVPVLIQNSLKRIMKLIDFPNLCLFFMTHAKNCTILIIKTSGFVGFNIKIYEILIITPALN